MTFGPRFLEGLLYGCLFLSALGVCILLLIFMSERKTNSLW